MDRRHTPPSPPQSSKKRFSVLLEENRDMALVYINSYLSDLVANTNTALLEFAEKAENNAVRARFYEAMGAVRSKKDEMELLFRQEIRDGFDHFGRPEVDGLRPPSSEQEEGDLELTLIEHEEVEESVATENLIARTRSDYYSELYALGRRLAVLNGGRKVEEPQIPAGPTQIVNAYRHALQYLDIDIKVKLVFYALLDRLVMRQLKPLYDEFNDNLKQGGILPNLKPVIRKEDGTLAESPEETKGSSSQEPPSAPIPEPATQTSDTSFGEELFASILDLMAKRHHRRGHGAGQRTATGTGAHAPFGTAPLNPAEARQRAVQAIAHIAPPSLDQSPILADVESLPNVEIDPEFIKRVKRTLAAEREQIFAEVSREEMSGIDVDTIDLIGMLFEYMLNDPLLPNLAKALLSHLHTPYLKLALLDRRLLSDSQHPARLLLDMLVEAGGQWVHENNPSRGIYPHMQTVVERILKEFSDDPSLFNEVYDYFRAAVEEHKRRTEAIEERSQEALKGREKLHIAKRRAASEIQARIGRSPLPKSVRTFLIQIWADRLVFILLRHPQGEASDEWQQAIEVVDQLVSLFLHPGPDTNETRIYCQKLRTSMETALEALGGYHQPAARETLRLLGHPEEVLNWRSRMARSPAEAEKEAQPLPGEEEGLETAASVPSGQSFFVEDSTLVAESLSPRERKILKRLNKLKFGTWFEFRPVEGPPVRLKLSWLSPLTSTCMFVDRSGVQAQIKPLTELAHELSTGQAKLIPKPSHPFVERTLIAIRNTLQKAFGKVAEA